MGQDLWQDDRDEPLSSYLSGGVSHPASLPAIYYFYWQCSAIGPAQMITSVTQMKSSSKYYFASSYIVRKVAIVISHALNS